MKKIALLFLICASQWMYAQTTPSIRKEYDLDEGNQKEHAVYTGMGNKNTLVYYNETNKREKEYRWYFDLLDENLNVLKHLEFSSSLTPYDKHYYYSTGNH